MSGPTLFVVLVAFGVVVGFASGLLGVGGGTLIVPFLTLAVGFSQHSAEATSLLVILPTAIVGSLVLRRRGVGDLGLAAGSIVGARIGAGYLARIDERLLKVVFGVFLVGVAVLLGVHG